MIEIIAIDTPTLGDRSYLVDDGATAFVVDPQRDIDRVLDLARERGLRITDVFETHIHNDYVTGGLALARATGAAYHVNAADPVSFERTPIGDGDVVEVGPSMRVRALATPGHTFTHLSYVLEAPGRAPAVFTGGSLLYGATGRPDLLGPAHTGELVKRQYASAHRLAGLLPDDAEIYPTHGFGSFCSAGQSEADHSTIGREKQVNPVLTGDEQAYVDELIAGLDAYPAYYAHMGPANIAGPDAPDLAPAEPADPAELRSRIEKGEWVVDLRSRVAFAAGHVAGTLNFGADGSFATYLGWLIPWGTPLSLLGDTREQIAEAQRELVRIGIDRVESATAGTPAAWTGDAPLGSFPRADFGELALVRHHRPVTILDVRRNQEWAGDHIDGATHIPMGEIPGRLDDVPEGDPLYLICRSGGRSARVAAWLNVNGYDAVNVGDGMGAWQALGRPMTSETGQPPFVR